MAAHGNHLGTATAFRLEEDGIHVSSRGYTGGSGLHRLGASNLGPVGTHGGVIRHVLGLERRHPHATSGKEPAQGSDQETLAYRRTGALDHQHACCHSFSLRILGAMSAHASVL